MIINEGTEVCRLFDDLTRADDRLVHHDVAGGGDDGGDAVVADVVFGFTRLSFTSVQNLKM